MKFAIQELIFGAGMFASLIDLNPACHIPTQCQNSRIYHFQNSNFLRFRIRNAFWKKKNQIYQFLKVKVKFKGQSKTSSLMFIAITVKILPRSRQKLISSKISQISKILKNSLHSFVSIYAVSFSSHSLQQTLFSVSRFRREQCESQSYSVYTLAAQWAQLVIGRGYNIIPNVELRVGG